MTEKALYKLAMEISGEDPARRGMIYGPAPYWYGGREVTGWFIIGKYSVLGVPEQIKWMRACPNENEVKLMFAAARPLIPPEGVDAAGYDISPLMLRKGIRAVTGGKYSHQVIYKPAGGVPALDARLLLRNLEAMKSRTVWFYEEGVKFGNYSTSFKPAYVFELGDADCPGAVWSALLPVNTAYDGPVGFTDCETHEHLLPHD